MNVPSVNTARAPGHAPHPIVTTSATFRIDAYTEEQVVDLILARSGPLAAGSPRLIVTPNMNHLAILQTSEAMGEAYRRADVHLADGWPVVRLARWLGTDLAGRTTGSGIVERLTQIDGAGRRIQLIGGSSAESSERAAAQLAAAGWSVRSHEASVEWLARDSSVAELVAESEEHVPDIVLIGVGALKQEDLALALMRKSTVPAVYLGVGAAIDFLAGEVPRAPVWMQRLHLEFLHRIVMHPGRMLRRYFGDVPPYIAVVLQSVRHVSQGNTGGDGDEISGIGRVAAAAP